MSRMWRLAATLALLMALSVVVPASADELEDDLADVEAQITALLAEMDDAGAERSGLANQIAGTRARVNELRAELAAAEDAFVESTRLLNLERLALDRARSAMADAYAALAASQDAVRAGRDAAEAAALVLYMRSGQEIPAVALTADSLDEASVAMAYMQRVAEHNSAAVTELERLVAVAESHRAEVVAHEAEIDAQVAELELVEQRSAEFAASVAERTAAVELGLAEQRSQLSAVDSEIALFDGELAALEDEQASIEALIAAEAEPSSSGGASTATTGYVRPVPGAITSAFGPRFHPILGYTRMHTGVDMTAPHGQTIRALSGGRVILASTYGGYGSTVIVDHGGGMTSLYAHQSSLNVAYGDSVEAGDIVGYAGSSGLATGPHLHFEVRINGAPVDPAPYLQGT